MSLQSGGPAEVALGDGVDGVLHAAARIATAEIVANLFVVKGGLMVRPKTFISE
jgi:hypothetical protein